MSEDKNTGEDKIVQIMQKAAQIAAEKNHAYITTEHVLSALMIDTDIKKVLVRASENADACKNIGNDLITYFESDDIPEKSVAMEPSVAVSTLRTIVDKTVASAKMSSTEPSLIDILCALILEDDTESQYILLDNDITIDAVRDAADHFELSTIEQDSEDNSDDTEERQYLRRFCTFLNEKAQKGKIDNLIGREDVIESTIETICRRSKNNVIYVGEPGVGKSAVAEGFAKRIADNNVPDAIKDMPVWSLDVGLLMAGTRYRGDIEERLTKIIAALKKEPLKPTLFIDEIHMIMGAGKASDGGPDVSNLLKPELARGDITIIGATTDAEYRKDIEKDKAMVRRFNKIVINEPDVDEAIKVLKGTIKAFEKFHGVSYRADAIEEAVKLSVRYMPTKVLPDKAFDIIDIAGSRTKLLNTDPKRKPRITKNIIEEVVSNISGVPVSSLKETEREMLKELRPNIMSSVFEQEDAVNKLCSTVFKSRAGLRPADKTAGAYLFVGPSGVGKTEVAKALAKNLGVELVRFDMSEYSEPHSVSKLIGSPPGYVGFDDPKIGDGKLINEAVKHPYSIFLLDEFEKAHPIVYQIFLQIFDNGKAESSSGKVATYQNIIFIMTSNAGAADMSKSQIGFNSGTNSGSIKKAIERTFTPEFRNRLDAIVEFNPLSKSTMSKIVDKFVSGINELAKEKGINIVLDDEAKSYFAEKGYDPKMGARPLSHLIESKITEPLSERILFGDLEKGGDIDVTIVEGEVVLNLRSKELVA